MRQRSIRVRLGLAAAVCLSLVAAACGSDDDGLAGQHCGVREHRSSTRGNNCRDDSGDHGQRRTPSTRRWPRRSPRRRRSWCPTDNCPADTTEALADGAAVKIGFIGPQTGPLAAFGVIGQGMKVYFDKINTEQGGVDGHQIEVVTKDDAYDPAKSAPAVQEAFEGDKIFASVFQIGTPNVAGTRQLHADACVPQALVGTGFPAWGDPQQLPVDDRRHPVVHRRGEGLGRVHQAEVPGGQEGRDPVVQQRLRQELPDDARRSTAGRWIRGRRRRRP